MKTIRVIAIAILALTALTVLGAHYLAPAGYEQQFRETPQAAPSTHHLLGTDELGRDRWARLLYGMRVSLTLAPLAALFTTVLAGAGRRNRGILWRLDGTLLQTADRSISFRAVALSSHHGTRGPAVEYFTGSLCHRDICPVGTFRMGCFSPRNMRRCERRNEVRIRMDGTRLRVFRIEAGAAPSYA